MRKCDMCYERQSKGKTTACAEACPVAATLCGERDELLAEARKADRGKPGAYYDKVYGVQEAGGTAVLYISAVPFDQIGLRTNVPMEALPETTWRALELVPDVSRPAPYCWAASGGSPIAAPKSPKGRRK